MRDPLARLRAADPVAEEVLPGAHSRDAQLLLTRILAEPRTRPEAPRPSLRRRRLVASLAVAMLAVGSIAGAYLVLRPVDDPVAFACYEGLDLDSDAVALDFVGALDPAACARPWSDGTLQNPAVAAPGEVPPFTACATDEGGLAVFPTDDVSQCDRPGLARPDPASLTEGADVVVLTEQLVEVFSTSECLTMEQAEAEVRAVLDEGGAGDWTIETRPATAERPCASLAVDAPGRAVTLVPVPRP